jgi:virulence factor Mce-like protein
VRIALRVALTALIAVGVYLAARAVTSTPSGLRVQAEFSDAHGLVVGNDVRIDGAPAGRVDSIALSSHGTAIVTMRLNDGLAQPRADATAAIRPVDLLGDTYVALSPGRAQAPLHGAIPFGRTLNDPRLDDLLRVFRAPQRAGLKAMLVELGIALDDRGVDLNQAALELRPALSAAQNVMQELGSQNADLRRFVADAQQVVAQGAGRSRDLGTLIGGLSATLRTTAAHASGLDAGLQTMPQTLVQARQTAGELAGTARAARPLAAELAGAAGGLSLAATRLSPFLSELARAARDLHPTLRAATGALTAADPTVSALASGLGAIKRAGPEVGRLISELVPAAPGIAQGFFVNFPDQAREPGTQPFDPFANPLRNYWRGVGVFTCQSFGLPIEPGCLSKFLTESQSAQPPQGHAGQTAQVPAATSSTAPRPRSIDHRRHFALPRSPTRRAAALPVLPRPVVSSVLNQLLGFLLRP